MEAKSVQLNGLRRLEKDTLIEIFDEYSPALYKYVMRTCRDPLVADEIVGDVFVRLLDQLSRGKGPHSNLRSYLFEATYHLLVDHERYFRRRIPLKEVENSIPTNELPEELCMENNILAEVLCIAMREKLTEYQRQVILLRFMEGLSLQETAVILGKSVSIIKAAQNRAMVTLRKCLCQWMPA